jgi:Pentapeptide repeats (9 copies)
VGASFEGFAFFNRIRCGEGADFECTRFRTGVSFTESLFGRATNWRGTQIGGVAWFHGARFGERTRFSGAQFGGQAHFDGAAFGDLAYFDGAQFGDLSSFRCVEFGGQITFAGKDWASVQRFYGNNYKERRDQAADLGMAPNCFAHVAFDGANFNGSVDFSGRDFTQPARFSTMPGDTSFKRPRLHPADKSLNKLPSVCLEEFKVLEGRPTCFAHAPRFHECKLHQDTSFDGAIFPVPRGNDGAARAYRTLKLAFSKQQAIREEQRFFKLEMQEEAARESGWK